jgi:hypothetical protein
VQVAWLQKAVLLMIEAVGRRDRGRQASRDRVSITASKLVVATTGTHTLQVVGAAEATAQAEVVVATAVAVGEEVAEEEVAAAAQLHLQWTEGLCI